MPNHLSQTYTMISVNVAFDGNINGDTKMAEKSNFKYKRDEKKVRIIK